MQNKCWISAWSTGPKWKVVVELYLTRAKCPVSISSHSCASTVSFDPPHTRFLRCFYYPHYLEEEENKISAAEITFPMSHSSWVLNYQESIPSCIYPVPSWSLSTSMSLLHQIVAFKAICPKEINMAFEAAPGTGFLLDSHFTDEKN